MPWEDYYSPNPGRRANPSPNRTAPGGGGGGGGGLDAGVVNQLINMPTGNGQNNNPGAYFNALATNNVGMFNRDAAIRQAEEAARASIYGADANRDAILGSAGINAGARGNEAVYNAGVGLANARSNTDVAKLYADAQRAAAEANMRAIIEQARLQGGSNERIASIGTGSAERIAGGRNDLLRGLGGGLFDTLGDVFGGFGQNIGNIGGSMALGMGGMMRPQSGVPTPQGFQDPYARMVSQLRGV